MTEKVEIVGVGHAKFGKRTDATLRELAHEAVTPALEDAEGWHARSGCEPSSVHGQDSVRV